MNTPTIQFDETPDSGGLVHVAHGPLGEFVDVEVTRIYGRAIFWVTESQYRPYDETTVTTYITDRDGNVVSEHTRTVPVIKTPSVGPMWGCREVEDDA